MVKHMLDILAEMDDEEKILLFSIGALDNTPLRSKIKLQKLLFLVSNIFPNLKDLLEIIPFNLGPYSEKIDWLVEDLETLGLVNIEKRTGTHYKLTNKGLDFFNRLKPKKELMDVIGDFKEFLNDLSDEEIMTFIYVSYPDYIDNSTKWDNLKNKRLHYAISLLKKEKVSFGKAVEISGLSNAEFMGKLKERGIKWK